MNKEQIKQFWEDLSQEVKDSYKNFDDFYDSCLKDMQKARGE